MELGELRVGEEVAGEVVRWWRVVVWRRRKWRGTGWWWRGATGDGEGGTSLFLSLFSAHSASVVSKRARKSAFSEILNQNETKLQEFLYLNGRKFLVQTDYCTVAPKFKNTNFERLNNVN